MSSIIPLFSSAVMVCTPEYSLNTEEKDYINNLDYGDNIGNLKSNSDTILQQLELKGLADFINRQIKSYTQQLLKLDESIEIYITQSWLNKSDTDQFHPLHNHPNSLLSGVMFLGQDANYPPIRFHRLNPLFPLELNYSELNDFNATCRWFEPVDGQLILFPSSLMHDVGRNKAGSSRCTLSFNTFVRGKLGNAGALTSVEI